MYFERLVVLPLDQFERPKQAKSIGELQALDLLQGDRNIVFLDNLDPIMAEEIRNWVKDNGPEDRIREVIPNFEILTEGKTTVYLYVSVSHRHPVQPRINRRRNFWIYDPRDRGSIPVQPAA